VWPIEERPVEKGNVPGEWYSPTQTFVTRPPAYDRQGFSDDDLIDFTPELKAQARKAIEKYKTGPLFTPPVVSSWAGPRATLGLPSSVGGSNWQGGAYDPETQMLYAFSATQLYPLSIVPPIRRGAGGTTGDRAAQRRRARARRADRPRAADREASLRPHHRD
jgi:quinoprotein glucose dehydrogenase